MKSPSTWGQRISASQPLYRPANWITYEQGLKQADIALAQLQTAEQDLVLRVSQAYFDVLASQDTLALVLMAMGDALIGKALARSLGLSDTAARDRAQQMLERALERVD